jgi:uncharacterized protein
MKIQVERLTETPSPLDFEGDTAWWRASMANVAELPGDLDAPFRVSLQAYYMGEDLYLEGRVEGSLELECGRCLARYRHPLREPFRLVLEPAGARQPADPEGAAVLARDGIWLGDDLDAGWFRGKEIDLSSFVIEVVALALPVKPLCREDCAGLCARCGADRNQAPCDCVETKVDSPFAALKALRDGLTGGRT